MKKFLKSIVLPALIFFIPCHAIPQSLDVMTFNIRLNTPADGKNAWDNRKSELLELLLYYEADFIGLQEVLKDQLDFIDLTMVDYKWIGAGRDDGKEKGEFSPMFYNSTKFELIRQLTFWLSENSTVPSIGWDAALERVCTYGAFRDKFSGDTIHVFNTHFDHVGQVARLKSAELILRKIKEFTSPESYVILMGDLNCNPESPPFQLFSSEMDYGKTVSQSAFYGPAGTFNGFDEAKILIESIDHIFTRNFQVLSYRHIDDRMRNNNLVSDHLPVLTKLKR